MQTSANFDENSPNARCWLRRSTSAERGGVPEHGRAAVAEHDLPTVGQREQLGAARRGSTRRGSSPAACDATCRSGSSRRPRSRRSAPGGPSTVRTRSARRRAGSRPGSVICGGIDAAGRFTRSGCQTARQCGQEIGGRSGSMGPVKRVSERLAAIAPSATLAVDAKAKALKAQGENVIGFGAGEPDFPTPAHIVEAAVEACRAAEEPRVHAGRRAARAEGGDRRQDPARLRLRVRPARRCW